MYVNNFVTLAQFFFKHIYDRNHHLLQIKIDDWIFFGLHKDYDIFSTAILKLKLFQQYTEFFQISERIENLTYKLDISSDWRVHFIFFIAHLESAQVFAKDYFQRILS